MKSAVLLIAAVLFNALNANPVNITLPTPSLPPIFKPIKFTAPPNTAVPPAPTPPPVPIIGSSQSNFFQIFNPNAAANCCTKESNQNLALDCAAAFQCPDFDYFINGDNHLKLSSANQIVTFAPDSRGLFIASIGESPALGSNGPLTSTPMISNYKMDVENNQLVIQEFWGQNDACFVDAGGPFAIALGDKCNQGGSKTMPIKFFQ